MRFFFDEHVPKSVSNALRQRNVDVVSVQEAGLSGRPDVQQLSFARNEHRVLVTFDADFLRIAASGVDHAGIVYCTRRSRDVGELVKGLVLLNEVLSQEEMMNKIEFL